MNRWERVLFIVALAISLGTLGNVGLKAQNPTQTPSYFTMATGVIHGSVTCPTPAANTIAYCYAGDGPWMVDSSGNMTSLLPSKITAGVSSLSVNGGTAQTGAVSITIPTTVKINAPPFSFNSSGTLTLSAPTGTIQ